VSEKLLGLLRKREWLHRERYDRAHDENIVAHDAGKGMPHSQEELEQLELHLLRSQIELEREESMNDPNEKGD